MGQSRAYGCAGSEQMPDDLQAVLYGLVEPGIQRDCLIIPICTIQKGVSACWLICRLSESPFMPLLSHQWPGSGECLSKDTDLKF